LKPDIVNGAVAKDAVERPGEKKPEDEMIINFLNDMGILSCFGSRKWEWDVLAKSIVYKYRLMGSTDEKENKVIPTFSEENVKAGFTSEFQKRFLTDLHHNTTFHYDAYGKRAYSTMVYQIDDKTLKVDLLRMAKCYYSDHKFSFMLGAHPIRGAQSAVRSALTTSPIFERHNVKEIFQLCGYSLPNSRPKLRKS
jgi:type IV secretory pathway VirB6-like protein